MDVMKLNLQQERKIAMRLTEKDKIVIKNHPVYIQEDDDYIRDFADVLATPEHKMLVSMLDSDLNINKGGMSFRGVICNDNPLEPYLDIKPVGRKDLPHCIVTMEELHEPFLAGMPIEDVFHHKVEEAINQAFLEGKLDPKALRTYACLPKDWDYDSLLKKLCDAATHPDAYEDGEEFFYIDTRRMEVSLCHVNIDDPEDSQHGIDGYLTLKKGFGHDISEDFTIPIKGLRDCRNGEMLRSFLESQITAVSHREFPMAVGIPHDFLIPMDNLTEYERKGRARPIIEDFCGALLNMVGEKLQLNPKGAVKLLDISVRGLRKNKTRSAPDLKEFRDHFLNEIGKEFQLEPNEVIKLLASTVKKMQKEIGKQSRGY